MTNDVINTAEEQTENQTSTVEQNNNQTSEAAAATEDKQVSPETKETKTEDAGETATAQTEKAQTEEPAPAEATPVQQESADKASEPQKAVSPEPAAEVDFGAILEQYEQEQITYHTGQIVQGKVVDVSERGVLIDFGYKSEGIVPLDEFATAEGETTIKKGDEFEVVIKNISSNDAPPVLSYTDAQNRMAWDTVETAYKNEETITGLITEKTKGGLKVDVKGIEAFLPGSQVDSRPVGNLDDFVGQKIEAKVIRFSRKRNNIVLSRKVLTDEVINKQKAETLSQIEEGYIVEGTVTNLTDYGAFVDIGGIDGLLHVTDMTWGRSQNPNDFFKVGENVQVKILKLDPEKEKVSLGYKQLLPDPWGTVEELYPIGSRVKGKVSSVTDYGAFVELEPGVEGLVHISEMSWSKRIKHPKNVVRKNDEIEVQILDIDPIERRISLGIKQLQPNPWDTLGERLQVGDKVRGKIRNLTDFGAFVEIEEGIEGLVHVSDITWSKKIKHPKDVLTKGQEVDAIITKLYPENRKISLSIKELTPSAWETFVATHKPGDIVKGKISRFANFGVFVELADELEGLCHISELSDERINDPEDQFKIGQELEFKILRIEPDTQKIGLSHRAVGKEDDPHLDTKVYSTGAKGGMASLGELANLKFGRTEEAKEEPVKDAKAEAKEDAAVQAETTETVSAETAESETVQDTAAESQTETAESPKTDDTTENASEETTADSGDQTEALETDNAEAAGETSPVAESDESPAGVTEEGETAETPQTDEPSAETEEKPAADASSDDEPSAETQDNTETSDTGTNEQAEEKTAQS